MELGQNFYEYAMGDFRNSSYVTKAKELVPVLIESARKQWGIPRLLDETAELLHQAGIFRMLQPQRFGGGETSPMEWLETLSTLAEGDPSVAWVAGVLGIHSFHLAHFSEQAQEEVWGNEPTALLSSPYAPNAVKKVDGGYLMSGIWRFASGVHHSSYALLGGTVVEEGQSENVLWNGDFRAFLAARSQFEIEEDWDVHGMRGTGSHNIVVRDQFIPEHRTLQFSRVADGTTPGRIVNPGILYQLPFHQVLGRITSSPVPLGALKGLANAVCEKARTRVTLQGQKGADDPAAAVAVANAYATVDEVKGNYYRNLGLMMKAVADGEETPISDRQMYRYQTSWAVQRIADLATQLYRSCGATGIYSRVPFGRYVNDILAVTGHASNNAPGMARIWAGGLMGSEIASGAMPC